MRKIVLYIAMSLDGYIADENGGVAWLGGDVWICGGASIANQLLDNALIDRFCITIIPNILGNGVRLFSGHEKQMPLRLISTQSYNGMTDLVYERR